MMSGMDGTLVLAQSLLVLLAAPLLNGLIKAAKAALQNRRGPGLLQPAFDIVKYLGRESVVSEHASWIFHFVPYFYSGPSLTAALLAPTIVAPPPLEALGDAI